MNILAINPGIIDCAAYDFWLKPYGFLVLLSYLKSKGIDLDYIDCLDKRLTPATFGRAKYYSQVIEKPAACKAIPRYFRRYGMKPDEFRECVKGKHPDYILITSSMTYWYPAIVEVTTFLKKQFPRTPIILGGTYASLCKEHAKKVTSCDFIFENKAMDKFFKLLGCNFNPQEFYSTLPHYEYFYTQLNYVVLRTSWGCPFECSFCAIKKLFPEFFRVPQNKIISFILKYQRQGVRDFVLYDDAFLYEPKYAKNLLAEIIKLKLNINFHTPNALHLRFLDIESAALLKEAGFINPHFGLETLNPQLQKTWGNKANKDDLLRAIASLKKAGFKNGEFSLYLLLGYPNQDLESLRQDVEFLHSQGARISLAEFSPVPGTKIFQEYKRKLAEPLLHNNSLFSLFQKEKIKEFWAIKNYVRKLNKKLCFEN